MIRFLGRDGSRVKKTEKFFGELLDFRSVYVDLHFMRLPFLKRQTEKLSKMENEVRRSHN